VAEGLKVMVAVATIKLLVGLVADERRCFAATKAISDEV
jgi:hypothetical protein